MGSISVFADREARSSTDRYQSPERYHGKSQEHLDGLKYTSGCDTTRADPESEVRDGEKLGLDGELLFHQAQIIHVQSTISTIALQMAG